MVMKLTLKDLKTEIVKPYGEIIINIPSKEYEKLFALVIKSEVNRLNKASKIMFGYEIQLDLAD